MSRDILSFQLNMIASSMIEQPWSRISWVTLILCFCLGSLVVSPLIYMVDTIAPSIYMIDLENSSGFDESVFDDDFSVPVVADLTIAGFVSSRFGLMKLDLQSALLLPDSPPPK